MDNKIIKIALISVLSYLIFKKLYDVLNQLLLWISVLLRIENDFIFLFLNILIGILSLLVLFFLYKHYLNEKKINTRTVYTLIILVVLLTVIGVGLTRMCGEYLSKIVQLENFEMKYLFQFTWVETMSSVFPIIGLLYFLLKINKNKDKLILE